MLTKLTWVRVRGGGRHPKNWGHRDEGVRSREAQSTRRAPVTTANSQQPDSTEGDRCAAFLQGG